MDNHLLNPHWIGDACELSQDLGEALKIPYLPWIPMNILLDPMHS